MFSQRKSAQQAESLKSLKSILEAGTPENLRAVYHYALPSDAVIHAHANLPMLEYLKELEPQVFKSDAVTRALECIIVKNVKDDIKEPVVEFLLEFTFSNESKLLALALSHSPAAFYRLVQKIGIDHTNLAQETLLHRLVGEGSQREYEEDISIRLEKLSILLAYKPNPLLRNAANLTPIELAFKLGRHLLAYRLAKYAMTQGISAAEIEKNISCGKVIRASLRVELNEIIKTACVCFKNMEQRLFLTLESLHTAHSLLAETTANLATEIANLKRNTVSLYNQVRATREEFEKLSQVASDAEMYTQLKNLFTATIEKFTPCNQLSRELITICRELPLTRCDDYIKELDAIRAKLITPAQQVAHRYEDRKSVIKHLMSYPGTETLINKITDCKAAELIPGMALDMAADCVLEILQTGADETIPPSIDDRCESEDEIIQPAGSSSTDNFSDSEQEPPLLRLSRSV